MKNRSNTLVHLLATSAVYIVYDDIISSILVEEAKMEDSHESSYRSSPLLHCTVTHPSRGVLQVQVMHEQRCTA